MNKHKSQSGSAYVIAAFILLIFLMGTLVFFYCRNFIKNDSASVKSSAVTSSSSQSSTAAKSSDTTSSDSDAAPKSSDTTRTITTDEPGIASDATFGTGMAVKYPDDWVLKHSVRDSVSYVGTRKYEQKKDESSITSPDGKITVNLSVDDMDYGLGVGDNDRELVEFETDSIKNYSDVCFASFIYYDPSISRYSYYVGALSDTSLVHSVKVGYTNENGDIDHLRWNMWLGGGSDAHQHRMLHISFNDISYPISSLGEINKAMATDNYKTAKQIVQSLYVKE